MVSDFELLATKILYKPRKTLNEGIIEAIKDTFAQSITNKALKYTTKALDNLQKTNPEAASELLDIIKTRDTEKLKNLFKRYNIDRILLTKFNKSKLQQEGIKNFIKETYQDIDAFLSEFRDTLNLSKHENFINTLVLFHVLGLCLFIGTVAITGFAGILITGTPLGAIKDIMAEMMFKSNVLDKILMLLSAGLFVSSKLKIQKD